MRSAIITIALLFFSSTPSIAHPQPIAEIQLISREDAAALDARDSNAFFSEASDLWKRKGGGGGGGKGGGSSGSSGSSGGSGSSSSGSSGSSSGSSSSGYVRSYSLPRGAGVRVVVFERTELEVVLQ